MYSRKHLPGEVRPARPARCCADALLTGVTTSDSMPVLGLYAFCLQKPGSMTYCAEQRTQRDTTSAGFLQLQVPSKCSQSAESASFQDGASRMVGVPKRTLHACNLLTALRTEGIRFTAAHKCPADSKVPL